MGQVKIGQQGADHVEAGTRREEDAGGAGMRLHPAYEGTVLQGAHRRSAGGHDAPAFVERPLDLQGRFRGQRVSFGVEANL